jgi:hypothetical protein
MAILSLLSIVSVPLAIWDPIGGAAVVAMIGFVAVGLIVGHVMGGPEPENSVVLALSTACRHPMIALTIASANFPDQRFGSSILLTSSSTCSSARCPSRGIGGGQKVRDRAKAAVGPLSGDGVAQKRSASRLQVEIALLVHRGVRQADGPGALAD